MKIIRNQKGSVTLFTLITMLFVSMYLVTMYITHSNTEAGQVEEAKRIKEIYEENLENLDALYDKIVDTKNYMNPYIPQGYYYVGGKWDNGFIISDNSLDGNKGSSYEISKELQGNQLVWIPVDSIDVILGTTDELEQGIQNYNETANDIQQFRTSVKKYGGFYIGRYETAKQVINEEPQPVIKSGETVWTQVNVDEAIQISKKFSNPDKNIISTIMNSEAWDTTCMWLKSKQIDIINSSNWGNHSNNSETIGDVAKTGQSPNWQACNIYDLAGNAGEWTTEIGTKPVFRGGSYYSTGGEKSVLYRQQYDNLGDNLIGFRVLLYIR